MFTGVNEALISEISIMYLAQDFERKPHRGHIYRKEN